MSRPLSDAEIIQLARDAYHAARAKTDNSIAALMASIQQSQKLNKQAQEQQQ